jgi:hypothetical protein
VSLNPTLDLFPAKSTDDYTELKEFLSSFATIQHVKHSPSGELYRVKFIGKQSVYLYRIDSVTGEDMAVPNDPFRRPAVGSLWFLRECVPVDFVPGEEVKGVK